MSPMPVQMKAPARVITLALCLILAVTAQACTPALENLPTPTTTPVPTRRHTPTIAPDTPTKRPTQTAVTPPTPTSTPSPTATPTAEYIPSPFPTSLEAFGMYYDPSATLELPPAHSISMLFWGQGMPVTPVESTPEFIAYPTPEPPPDAGDPLVEAGCQAGKWWWDVTCSPDSPLNRFDCAYFGDPQETAYGLQPHIPLAAICQIMTDEHEIAKAGGLYLVGCAFRREIHYIFKIGDEYVLVSSAEELKEMFAPIDSPQEAVSYAQLVTGTDAVYGFSYDPTLMYFHEVIEGTHVTQTGGIYEMNLFNFAECGCEPNINTQIELQVDRAGKITWKSAIPVFMTTGWSCAD